MTTTRIFSIAPSFQCVRRPVGHEGTSGAGPGSQNRRHASNVGRVSVRREGEMTSTDEHDVLATDYIDAARRVGDQFVELTSMLPTTTSH